MKTLTENLNLKFGEVADAHIMKRVNLGLAAYDTLCLICSEQNIDMSLYSDVDCEAAADAIQAFCLAANEDTGHTVSVWFD